MRPVIFFLLFPFGCVAQNMGTIAKKLSLSADQLVLSEEKFQFLPRGFVYDLQRPDSVLYLSCVGSDQKDFHSFMNGEPVSVKLKVPNVILRSAGEISDTVQMCPYGQLLANYSTAAKTPVTVNPATRYLLIYYLPEGNIKPFRKNVRYFEKYIRQHPDLHFQSIYAVVKL